MTVTSLGAPTLAHLPTLAAQVYGDRTAIRFKSAGGWQDQSYAELAGVVEDLGRGLPAAGVAPGDRVALLAGTRPEWTWCDLAIARAGAVCVPVYPTSSKEEAAWVLADSGARLVICGTREQAALAEALSAELPSLDRVVTIDDGGLDLLRELGATTDPAELERRTAAVRPDDLSTIVYTSGTTGPPKGCMLTHGNWRATLAATGPLLEATEDDVVYLYLPLAHLLSRIVQIMTFEHGATLAYFGGDIRAVVTELAEVAPTHLPSVPRLFEKVYAQVAALAPDPQRLRAAVELGLSVRRGEPVTEEGRARFAEAEERLYGPVRAVFGGRVRQAISGAAPIATEILDLFAACGVPIYEAYGMTEATAVITMNGPGRTKVGTVGRPLDGVQVRIAADGEVLARGANTFPGYFNDAAATAETLADGWLHTGDLGALDADGYLSITGRKKDIIITAAGKNLTPANIENDLRRCRWISYAVLHGDRRPHPVALLTLDAEEILPWATERGLPEDLAELAAHPDVRALIEAVVEEANARYAPPARIRGFAILDHDFTVEDGQLTPSLKVKRPVVSARYRDILDGLYA